MGDDAEFVLEDLVDDSVIFCCVSPVSVAWAAACSLSLCSSLAFACSSMFLNNLCNKSCACEQVARAGRHTSDEEHTPSLLTSHTVFDAKSSRMRPPKAATTSPACCLMTRAVLWLPVELNHAKKPTYSALPRELCEVLAKVHAQLKAALLARAAIMHPCYHGTAPTMQIVPLNTSGLDPPMQCWAAHLLDWGGMCRSCVCTSNQPACSNSAHQMCSDRQGEFSEIACHGIRLRALPMFTNVWNRKSLREE